MAGGDPRATQRDDATAIGAELGAAGFEDAEQIGRGGFGMVYRCRQRALDRTVAVKILTVSLDEENLARFLREQRAMGRLTGHPNIVHVLQVGTTDSGRPYLVMPYYPQTSLDAWIRRQGPLSVDDALRMGVRLAGALDTTHRLGVLHRDVKPANVLLTEYGEPVLTDFGIAHIEGGFETETGAIIGSPAFTAPEVLSGERPSVASDIYGLGATLFAALTGHAAFERRQGEQVVAQFLRITTQPVPDLRENGFPDDISRAVERAMDADPRRRPSTAAAFGHELQQIQVSRGQRADEMALLEYSGRLRPGLPDAVRPVRRVGNLPAESTTFVGRRREVSAAKKRLTASRALTLTGIGGVGKTRLALRVATELQPSYRDGAWLVELGELNDEALLVDVVAEVLDVRDSPGRSLEDAVVDFVASRQLLLVLDNCEQIVDAAARLADRLLRHCPDLRILATSREPLGIRGEVVMRVSPLSVPPLDQLGSVREPRRFDALKLFVERAAAAVPDFELTEYNRAAVVEVCTRLDGLPLPIELAAARMRVMSAEQLRQRLAERFTVLTTAERHVPTRQRTLRLSIDWSYDLCTPAEQQLWQQLSIFAGSFGLEAVEYLSGGTATSTDVLDRVTALVDKSIMIREQHDDQVRFRMLETIRQYGREKAQQCDEYLGWRHRHREWFEQMVLRAEAEWVSPRQLDWITCLNRELPNLREALEFASTEPAASRSDPALRMATALFPYWLARGLLNEGRHWLGRMLMHPLASSNDRIDALYAHSVLAELQGDLATGAELVEQCKALVQGANDPLLDARADHAAGLLALYSGDLVQACTHLERALAVFDAEHHLSRHVWILVMLGLAYELRGDTDRAIECHRKVLAITEAHGEFVYRSYSQWALGVALFQEGDHHEARVMLEQALGVIRRVGEPLAAAVCLEALAWTEDVENRAERAAVLMGAAESLGRATGSSSLLFRALDRNHAECEKSARITLGNNEFEARLRHGRGLGLDDAVDYALDG
ncbi:MULTISPECIES: protein kinase [Rhodococcus]|uniref:protein kinase domain-containing protein n=1 Tax=Rhodococcus TaxID=1827 RepID=UPI000C9CF00B|nr:MULTISPECIES: protein kinase [Rhodococcus]PND51178.1 protein kinase [Rhodococcus sp. ENV425]WKW99593.1 protein kinase [Rhodococcus aetherivorans]